MEKQVKTPKMIRQRKFLLVLPLLVLPFATMIFWALGGGKAENVMAQTNKGFNINLPDANLRDEKPMDKMSYYDQAQLDSARFLELEKNDPSIRDLAGSVEGAPVYNDSLNVSADRKGLNTSLYGTQGYNDPNADRIHRKLAELDRELNKPVPTLIEADNSGAYKRKSGHSNGSLTPGSSEVERLEQMMEVVNQSNGGDTELNQLNGMLEKILDVQHPERIQQKLKQASKLNRGKVFVVSPQERDNSITLLDTARVKVRPANGFYSITGAATPEDSQNAIQAVIHETQELVNGSTVKLRLVNDVFINGVRIPKNSFLHGSTQLNGERLIIKIANITYQQSLFPVELSVYDMDGIEGIRIPGAINRDVAKESSDRALQGIGYTTLDPSLGAQAVSAGIAATKTLMGRKVKLIRVVVKAGYHVLLYDEKQKDSN